MKLALWQAPSPAGDEALALATLDRTLTAAAAAGATLLVAPEAWLPGYNFGAIPERAQVRGGAWHGAVAGMCRRTGCGVVLGYAERDGAAVYNAAVVFDADGAELAHYRKIQLYGPREKSIYTPGETYCRFQLGDTPTALLICYDIEFAPHVRALAERGVQLILVPTANMQPTGYVSQTTVPAQAVNHGVTIAYANYCGSEGDLDYCGGSVIAAADGAILAMAGPGEALLVVDLARQPDHRLLQTQLADYRPAR